MGMDWGEILASMGVVAWTVVALLLLMSIYIIAAAIERALTYRESAKQSRLYATARTTISTGLLRSASSTIKATWPRY